MAKKRKKPTKKPLAIKESEENKKPTPESVNPVRGQRGVVETQRGQTSNRVKKTKVRVIGIGGGGGSIVSEIASRAMKASFVAANTDCQALKTINRAVLRFQFGQNLTHGLGTGMNAEIAETAAQEEKEKIKKLLAGQDFCIFLASLGGGVGSGAGPVFAKIAKNLGVLTLGVFTLPFKFEGERKMEIAKEALQKLRPNLNAIIILPNERIFQIIDKNIPLRNAFSAINKNLSDSLEGLIETIYLPGLINIDFADLKTILQGQGKLGFLNTVEVQSNKGGQELVKRVISSPLYPYTIRGARGVLFNIAGERELFLSDVSQVSKTISELASPEAKIIFGICQNKKYQNKIKVTLLAVGCSTKIFSSQRKKKKSRKKKEEKAMAAKSPESKKEKPKRKPSRSRKAVKPHRSRPQNKIKQKKKKHLNLFQILRGKSSGKPPGVKRQKSKKEEILQSPKETPKAEIKEKTLSLLVPSGENSELKVRKTALQVKKEAEEAERELIEREKIWESPAFLRKLQSKSR